MRGGDTSSGFSPGTVDVASGPRTTEEEGLAGRSASARQGGRGARVFAGKPLDRLAGPETGWTAGMRSACAIRRGARLREPQPRNRATCQLCRAP